MQSSVEQAALERAKQMYSNFDTRRTKSSFDNISQTTTREDEKTKPIETKENQSKEEKPKNTNQPKQINSQQMFDNKVSNNENEQIEKKSENLLDYLMKDKEKSLIMLLIIILSNDGADSSLLLALMYLVT